MIDPDFLRSKEEAVASSITKRGLDKTLLLDAKTTDDQWRKMLHRVEQLRQGRNQLSASSSLAAANATRLKKLKSDLAKAEKDLDNIQKKRDQLIGAIPNLLDDSVPEGDESANKVIASWGRIRLKQGHSHEDLMSKLGWLNLEAAAKFSGSRFRYLCAKAAIAHLKLMMEAVNFAAAKGFIPIIPPILVKKAALELSGFFPFHKEGIFALKDEDLFLTGTSEPTLLALIANQRFKKEDLPLRFVGFSSCFRKEAGSYGKDVKGMFRQHQFDKVELVSVTVPEASKREHEYLLSIQEGFVRRFNVPYRVMLISSMETGPTASLQYDIESWFPSQQRYRETHSASNCTDFQARRLKAKVDLEDGTVYVHTLNATLATERLLLAIIENNQDKNGKIKLPWRLR